MCANREPLKNLVRVQRAFKAKDYVHIAYSHLNHSASKVGQSICLLYLPPFHCRKNTCCRNYKNFEFYMKPLPYYILVLLRKRIVKIKDP